MAASSGYKSPFVSSQPAPPPSTSNSWLTRLFRRPTPTTNNEECNDDMCVTCGQPKRALTRRTCRTVTSIISNSLSSTLIFFVIFVHKAGMSLQTHELHTATPIGLGRVTSECIYDINVFMVTVVEYLRLDVRRIPGNEKPCNNASVVVRPAEPAESGKSRLQLCH